jgi:uncharacterized protein (UPF0335 family)
MTKSICAAVVLLLLLDACGGARRVSSVDIANPQTAAGAAADPEFVELGLDQFSSPFSKQTVLKLNAIVGRSLAAIKEYDGALPAVQDSVAASLADKASARARAEARKNIARIERLANEATSARTDLYAAEAELKASGEKYNDVILAGMIIFVEKVDDELQKAAADLSARIGD